MALDLSGIGGDILDDAKRWGLLLLAMLVVVFLVWACSLFR